MEDKENITTMPAEHKQITRRIGTMDTTKYQQSLAARDESTPGIVGTDSQVMQIAKGMGRKIFNNPMELAESLTGFEDWCLRKNVTPSFIGLAVYLNISKGTLLKYMKDETTFTVFIVINNITGEYIYSNTDKSTFNKYISSTYEVEGISNSNSSISNNNSGSKGDSLNNSTISIKDKINSGVYNILYRTVSFADVLAPVRSLVELSTTNRAWDMKNPAFGIFLAKNKFGETTHYSDKQEVQIEAKNPIDEASDEDILKAAKDLPE